jgi:hypothetical protein
MRLPCRRVCKPQDMCGAARPGAAAPLVRTATAHARLGRPAWPGSAVHARERGRAHRGEGGPADWRGMLSSVCACLKRLYGRVKRAPAEAPVLYPALAEERTGRAGPERALVGAAGRPFCSALAPRTSLMWAGASCVAF